MPRSKAKAIATGRGTCWAAAKATGQARSAGQRHTRALTSKVPHMEVLSIETAKRDYGVAVSAKGVVDT